MRAPERDDDLDEATGVRFEFQRDPGVRFKFASTGDSRIRHGLIAAHVENRWKSWRIVTDWMEDRDDGTIVKKRCLVSWYFDADGASAVTTSSCPVLSSSSCIWYGEWTIRLLLITKPRSITLSRRERRYFHQFQEFSKSRHARHISLYL